MSTHPKTLLVLALSALSLSTLAAQELITNGDFETGLTGSHNSAVPSELGTHRYGPPSWGSGLPTGWSRTGSRGWSITYAGTDTAFPAANGNYVYRLDANALEGVNKFSQGSLQLTAGTTYQLTFAMWSEWAAQGATISVNMTGPAAISVLNNYVDAVPGIEQVSTTFTPTVSGSYTIEFSTTGTNDNHTWIDNVSLTVASHRFATVSSEKLVMMEGHAGSYQVSLTWDPGFEPTADVVVTASLGANGQYVSLNGQAAGQPATVEFTAASGWAAQTIQVTAVDDSVDTGRLKSVPITHSLASADPNWDQVGVAGVTCRIVDDEAPPATDLLWYDTPAVSWETHALPIGNGSVGAMLFGDPSEMVAHFNEDSLWTGNTSDTGNYQSFGYLRFAIDGMSAATNYRRQLDIGDAIHTTNYTVGNTNFKREAFASFPDSALIMRCSADQPGSYSGTIRLTDDHGGSITAIGNHEIQMTGTLSNGMKYAAKLRVIAEGGTLVASGNTLTVTSADSVLFILSADTDYLADYSKSWHGPEPLPVVDARITAAATRSFADLKTRHLADFQPFMQRCSLDLGASDPALEWLTTEERLLNFWQTKDDPDFEELIFQYGRYLLVASSRPGSMPPNLQGLWNPMNNPPWRSDYHSDINVDMNYWLSEVTNLSDLHQPFFDHVKAMIPAWKARTANTFGTDGWSIWFETGIHGGGTWKWNLPGNAWYAQQFWTHYAYTKDETFLLNEALPVFRGVCEFWEDRLIEGPGGIGLISPSGYSPEHGPEGEDGVTYDQQLVWDAFTNYIQACEILGVESAYAATVSGLRDQLAPLKIGSWGQLQEWLLVDRDQNPEEHRHLSHLVAVFPGRQIDPGAPGDAALANAAKVSLIARGDGGAGWALPWKAALWARYGDGDHARSLLVNKLKPILTTPGTTTAGIDGTTPNLLTIVWGRYQIDGTFGYTGALAEMLLQSHGERISLLPALPAAWSQGSVTGLRARGGFEVDVEWANGALSRAVISSDHGGQVPVRYNNVTRTINLAPGGSITLKRADFINDYPAWIEGFDTGSLDGFAEDANGDGLANGLVFLLGGDPTIAGNTPLPTVSSDASEYVYSFDRHDRAIGAMDVVLQISDDLQFWDPARNIVVGTDTASSGPEVTITDNGLTDHVEIRISIEDSTRKFFRIRATESP